jgi:hypothetical protein
MAAASSCLAWVGVSFVPRLTAEQIDQVVALLRSKNEEYLALGGTAEFPGRTT